MNDEKDYRLVNIQKKEIKLRQQRHEIIVSDSEKALDMILDAKAPATLTQSFPDQDLYYLMHKIGPYDFIPVLAMATSEQWEYVLDVEVWDNDRIDIEYMTKIFDVLYKADPHRLLRWAVKEKPAFFEFYLFKNMVVKIREHDELPPEDFNDYITIDDKFYFRFPEKPKNRDDEPSKPKNSQEAWELIEKMLKAVAQMDLSVFHGILLETESVLPSEIEEEEFRLKNLRLAEKGFLPFHEAMGIYQPARIDSLRKRPDNSSLKQKEYDPEIPLPPQFFSQFLKGDNLFVKSLKLFDPKLILLIESELAALINKVISADKIKLKAKEDLEKAIIKTCDYLNLGLEIILKGKLKPELARDVILKYFLEDIFRTGSRAGIKLKTKAVNWFKQSFTNKNNLPLSFLGENFLGVIGGLFLDRPLFFKNYASGELYSNFKSIADIHQTSRLLKQIIAADTIIGKLNIDIKSFKLGILTYKTLILTLWAKEKLKLPLNLEPIDTTIFKDFFKALFQKTESETDDQIQLNDLIFWVSETTGIKQTELTKECLEVLTDLINELEQEYAAVDPENIDPRFIPHFLLTKS
ncbi:MAG: DUF6178 family protein [Deltaproteobacteria bacterium]|jgi:hypothetical protein|nr:DUF6178 family protein [Deltaproteobacteria bacterium]